MAWIGKREQILVGFLFVLLLVTATAGRLAAAGDGQYWLASPPVGMVSVAGAVEPEGPSQPTVNQVQVAMQRRITGFELATIQSNLELVGLRQQLLTLRGQLGESNAKLRVTQQDLESAQDQLMNERSMRENLSRELTQAYRHVQVLSEQLRHTESQVVLLKTQLAQPAQAEAPLIDAKPGSKGQP